MNGKRILVIEDDAWTQKVITDTLKTAGYEVATAREGSGAMKMVREMAPDLITLDVQLAQESPDDSWDGFGVANWLRRMNEGKPLPPFIVISAMDPSKVIAHAAAIGAYTFLPKPFTKQALLDAVAGALTSQAGPTPTSS
jgi:CheY-like chemotaxis protein